MIKICNLNKYYNKNSSKEIHVINDVNLELEDKGIVTILGKSGSGKTTLLNVIGGLDNASGSVFYDDLENKDYDYKLIDEFRKKSIGYIFQNYLLIEDLSIYDNLRKNLELLGITDKDEVDKRVKYALEAVGLYKYRNKLAGSLSGGEKQRVAIARVLVKKCKIIIADEPTGNLDSDNTIEVMNILYRLSKISLVILVTHNEEIALSFSNRIIRIVDGKVVSDSKNEPSLMFNESVDNNIYLKDLKKEEKELVNKKLEAYYLDEKDLKDLRIVIKNNVLYLDSDYKIVNLRESDINLYDAHKKVKSVSEDKKDFDVSFYDDSIKETRFKKFKRDVLAAYKGYKNSRKIDKIFHAFFAVIGLILGVSTSLFSSSYFVDGRNFDNEEVYSITQRDEELVYNYKLTKEVYDKCLEGKINEVYPQFLYEYLIDGRINSNRSYNVLIDSYIYPYDLASEYQVYKGNDNFVSFNDVVIGSKLADYIVKELKLDSYNSLINVNMKPNSYDVNNEEEWFRIIGISEKNTNSIYLKKEAYRYFVNNNFSFMRYPSSVLKECYEYKVSQGRDISNNNEVLINEDLIGSSYYIGRKFMISKNGKDYEFEVVGSFKGDSYTHFVCNQRELTSYYLVSDFYLLDREVVGNSALGRLVGYDIEDYKDQISAASYDLKPGEVLISKALSDLDVASFSFDLKVVGYFTSSNPDLRFAYLGNKGVYNYSLCTRTLCQTFKVDEGFEIPGCIIEDIYTHKKKVEISSKEGERISGILISSLVFVLTTVYVYFATRSALLNKVKKIGVLRSIGASKGEIRRIYLYDAIIESLFTSLLFYTLSVLFYNIFLLPLLGARVTFTKLLFNIIVGIIILLINVIFALLPVNKLLKSTPSQINSKYEI